MFSSHSPALCLCFSMSCNNICPGLGTFVHNLLCLLKTLLLVGGEARYQKVFQIADTSAVPMERGAERECCFCKSDPVPEKNLFI